MSTKKCACFTPSGLVYTRLETDGTILRRPSEYQKENTTRNRRSIDNDVFEPNTVESILEENPSIGHLRFLNEPFNEVENKSVKDRVDELIKQTEAYIEAYERTKENIDHKRIKRRAQHLSHNKHKQKNDVLETNESSLECKIEKDGTVNCSQIIYNDLKAWHTNRLSLEDQIRQLRTKLEDLKEIKRHLKTSKPMIDLQTVVPHYANQNHHLRSRNTTHETTSKDQLRKTKLHRMKFKHRNNTLDKKFKQPNGYTVSTVNSVTKENTFSSQLKNEPTTEATTLRYELNMSDDGAEANNTELPKPQITTIIIEKNYFDQNRVDDQTTLHSLPTILDDITTTEYLKPVLTSTTKQKIDEYIIDVGSSVRTPDTSHLYDAIDKLSTTPKFTNIFTFDSISTVASTSTSKPTIKYDTTASPSLGPTRFDASEYEQRNPNQAGADLGVFSKPTDIFQRRLHPLFIENEDKHVCYCEENRYVF